MSEAHIWTSLSAEMFSKIFDELDIDNQIDDDFDVVIEANNFRVFFIIPTEEDDYYSFVWPRLFFPPHTKSTPERFMPATWSTHG